ncbi:zonular occludens toxin family protein [Pasteurella multocida]
MAIMAYVGIPGSGKSYEVVSSVIVEHFKKGRRIVTNIEGISEDKLIDYCLYEDKKLTREDLGTLIKVTDEDCQSDEFFPYKNSQNTTCRAGDLICLDEVWRIFPSEKIKDNHRSFIAEHRHFTDEKTGICCDLVVINQSITNIPRFIKDRIETTFQMSRLVTLGLGKRYRVNVYSGAKTTKAMLTTQYQNKYNEKIFKLYKSFDGANGKTISIDDRQNYFKSPQFKLSVLAIVSFFGFAYYMLSDYINVNTSSNEQSSSISSKPSQQKEVKTQSQIQQETAKLSPADYFSYQKQQFNDTPQILSKTWRISGELLKNGISYVLLVDDKGNLRIEPKYYFKGQGRALTGVMGGEVVSYYSGVKDEKSIL